MSSAANALASQISNGVRLCSFRTTCPPPALSALPGLPSWLTRCSLPILASAREDRFLRLAAVAAFLRGGDITGAKRLNRLFKDTYQAIWSDPNFVEIRSAIPQCFSARQPQEGHYFCFSPKNPSGTETIVFLHGMGGNFMFNMWALKTEFPDATILVPSWGVSWSEGALTDRVTFLREMLHDFVSTGGVMRARPWLIGISEGACAGFEIAAQCSGEFRGYVSIAGVPRADVSFPTNFPILMINGTEDQWFPLLIVQKCFLALHEGGLRAFHSTIEGDHFFFLTKRSETASRIRKFQEKIAAEEDTVTPSS